MAAISTERAEARLFDFMYVCLGDETRQKPQRLGRLQAKGAFYSRSAYHRVSQQYVTFEKFKVYECNLLHLEMLVVNADEMSSSEDVFEAVRENLIGWDPNMLEVRC